MSRTGFLRAYSPTRLIVCASLCFGCSDGGNDAEESAVERGRQLFEAGPLSDSGLNVYSCASCHEQHPSGGSRIFPGAAMAGSTLRPSFWGGQENDLLRSLEDCRTYFMYANSPLDREGGAASDLYAFLASLEPGNAEPVPFSVVRTVEPLPRGDAARGAELFTNACSACHGTMHEGAGALRRVPALPDATLLDHPDSDPAEMRLIFIEKVRHGGFLGYGGAMPPFSSEVLGDAELSDILEALGVLGE
ncbi:MAG TPA: c-type cytochrome [Polyangiaceae bacterium]